MFEMAIQSETVNQYETVIANHTVNRKMNNVPNYSIVLKILSEHVTSIKSMQCIVT